MYKPWLFESKTRGKEIHAENRRKGSFDVWIVIFLNERIRGRVEEKWEKGKMRIEKIREEK